MTSQVGRADWTKERDAFLVEKLKEQQENGRRSATGWNKQAWKAVLDEFNARFNENGNVQQLKSRAQQLKRSYRIVHELRKQSGFGWDDVTHVPTASDTVWKPYLEAHPEARSFRKSGLALYDELDTIFRGTCADGEGQISSLNPHPVQEEINVFPLETQDQPTASFPSTQRDVDDLGSSSEKDMTEEASNASNRRSASGGHVRRGKRSRKSGATEMSNAMKQLCTLSARILEPKEIQEVENSPYGRCLAELQELEGISDEERLKLVEILKEDKNAIAFLMLKGDLRLKWLESKLFV